MDRKVLYISIGAYILMLGITVSLVSAGYDHIPVVNNHEMQFKYIGY